MASPQIENGFTRIANELMMALCRLNISGPEYMIALTVITKTYGWNKKEDQISLSQFQSTTKMTRPRIVRAIRNLVRYGVLGNNAGNTSKASTYWINKDYEKWCVEGLKTIENRPIASTSKRTTQPSTHIHTTPSTVHTEEASTFEGVQLVRSPIYLTKDTTKDTTKETQPNQYYQFLERFGKAYQHLTGQPFHKDKKHFALIKRLIDTHSAEEVEKKAKVLAIMCSKCASWFTKDGYADFTIETLSRHWNSIIPQIKKTESEIKNDKFHEALKLEKEKNELYKTNNEQSSGI